MSKFNQELITKARNGEIAILNDGSVEEIRYVLQECWPADKGLPNVDYKYYYSYLAQPDTKFWSYGNETPLPAHSVKEFFMLDTKDTEIAERINQQSFQQPRTYRVTRQQMGIICSAIKGSTEIIYNIMANRFALFDQEAYLHDEDISMLNSICTDRDELKKYFPEYFLIPEGEPVLVRETDSYHWLIAISDGKGGAYTHFNTPESSFQWTQIIPFTKNPPK